MSFHDVLQVNLWLQRCFLCNLNCPIPSDPDLPVILKSFVVQFSKLLAIIGYVNIKDDSPLACGDEET
jgi:hypothetical protein